MDLEEVHRYPSHSHQPYTATQFLACSDTQGSLTLISACSLAWDSGLLSPVPSACRSGSQLISPSFVFYAESLDPPCSGIMVLGCGVAVAFAGAKRVVLASLLPEQIVGAVLCFDWLDRS
jgi:hypothetical protein